MYSKLVLLVGTKLEHVVSVLALEIAEPSEPSGGTQVKPRDALFWFGKPGIILRLIQFISFQVIPNPCLILERVPSNQLIQTITFLCILHLQNAFEMATFIWSLVRLNLHYFPSSKNIRFVLWIQSLFIASLRHISVELFRQQPLFLLKQGTHVCIM